MSAATSMIEKASEFGASAAVPLMSGDSTHMSAGDMLRQAREAHGLHLDMVAAALKVTPQKLAALESDDIEA
jgi:cytoskeleton protein RodZ